MPFRHPNSRFATVAVVGLATLLFPAAATAKRNAAESDRDPADAYYSYLRAHRAIGAGDYRESAEHLQDTLKFDPDATFLYLELAETFLLEGEPDRAERSLRRLLEAAPENADARLLLAEVYLRQIGRGKRSGYIDLAVEQYLEAIRLRPDDPNGVLQLGNLYRNVGRTEEALRLLEDFRSRYPGSPAVNVLLANTLINLREYDRAERVLLDNLSTDPIHLESVDLLAGLYETLERYEEAIDLYGRIVDLLEPNHYLLARLGYLNLLAKRYPEAVSYLEQARQLAPLNESILINLAQALEENGDLPVAVEAYEGLLRLSPGNRSFRYHLARLETQLGRYDAALQLYRDLAADLESGNMLTGEEAESATITYLQMGTLFLRWSRPDEAVQAFQKAMKYSSGERRDVYLFLGRAYMEAEKYDQLSDFLQRAEKKFPGDIDFALLNGEALLNRGKTQDGLRRLRALWKEEPEVPRETFLYLADMLVSQKEYAEAGQLIDRGIELFPGDDMMYFQMGALQERQGSLAEAETQFRKALAVNPDNPLVLNYLGYMLVEAGGRLEESLGYIRKAVELDRYNPAYLDSLGWVYFKLDRLDLARDNLEAAVRLSRGDPVIEDHLGDLYFRLGRVQDAVEAWNRALEGGVETPADLRDKIRRANRTLEGSQ
jgi:tetratricopeptide (TPR) repeat protein